MSDAIRTAADAIVQRAAVGPVSGEGRVPGVVAGVTDRSGEIYLGAAGVRDLSSGEPVVIDTIYPLWSTTKAVTGTAALQLVEQGDLDLQAPAKEYAPAIGELQVITGFSESGEPILRPPVREVTTHHLLVHTAGFGYDFFNETYHRLATEHGQPSVATSTARALRTPLLFDAGEKWEYGSNIDWVGQVVEGITGQRLGDVLGERLFRPLGATELTFEPSPEQQARTIRTHQRESTGTLTPSNFALPVRPEVHFGGHGLFGTVSDYLTFLRLWLNDGRADSGEQLLRPETVAWASENHLGDELSVTVLPGVIPWLSNDAEFFPGQRKTWSYTFQRNEEKAPTGRPAGALGWAGLANLFYWLDRENGIAGYWATQILPFGDAASFGGFLDFETAVYQALAE